MKESRDVEPESAPEPPEHCSDPESEPEPTKKKQDNSDSERGVSKLIISQLQGWVFRHFLFHGGGVKGAFNTPG